MLYGKEISQKITMTRDDFIHKMESDLSIQTGKVLRCGKGANPSKEVNCVFLDTKC
jgi:hypothetical protein